MALQHNLLFWPSWVLTRGNLINGSTEAATVTHLSYMYKDPMIFGTYMDTYQGVGACPGHYGNYNRCSLKELGEVTLD